mmetsp:Transcript_29833/g.75050  ORF Transcript_29833/g.75050 Transcript_29833/m.75050 type:complete len:602 (+) Transcript_29833:95-1900(+)
MVANRWQHFHDLIVADTERCNVGEAIARLGDMVQSYLIPSREIIFRVTEAQVEARGYRKPPKPTNITVIIGKVAQMRRSIECSGDLMKRLAAPFTKVIDIYAKEKKRAEALATFCIMIEIGVLSDAWSYNSLMMAFPEPEYVLNLYSHMEAGVEPDTVTVNKVMQAYLQKGDPNEAEAFCRKYGFWDDKNIHVLAKHYADEGNVDEAYRVITQATSPNHFHLHALILACASSRSEQKCERALELFEQFKDRADQRVYGAMVLVFMRAGQHEKAEDWFKHMKEKGLPPDAQTYNYFVKGYARLHMLEKAMQWIDRMEEDGVQRCEETYNTLLKCADSKNFKWRLYKNILNESIPLTRRTYQNFVTAFQDDGEENIALQLWREARRKGLWEMWRKSDGCLSVREMSVPMALITVGESLFKEMTRKPIDDIEDVIIDCGKNSPTLFPAVTDFLKEKGVCPENLGDGRLLVKNRSLQMWKERKVLIAKNSFIDTEPSLQATSDVTHSAPDAGQHVPTNFRQKLPAAETRQRNRNAQNQEYVGVIKSYDEAKGCGFIVCQGIDNDVYMHKTVFVGSGFNIGDVVRCRVFWGEKDGLPRASRPLKPM